MPTIAPHTAPLKVWFIPVPFHTNAVDISGTGWFVGCLTSQQNASVSQGQICSDNFMCCHTEMEVGDQTFHLTHSQYTDTGPTSPSTDHITPGVWQGSHWSHWHDWTPEKSWRKRDSNPGSSTLKADTITTRPTEAVQEWEQNFNAILQKRWSGSTLHGP